MLMRISHTSVTGLVSEHLVDYPTPSNINYFWGFGSIAGLVLTIQIITGVFLVMHYTAHIDLAFSSLEHVMRNVNYGWVIRYIHSNGASMFFVVVYFHIARGLYYGSFLGPRHQLWTSGALIFAIMIITAFLGYVLPWGQMSFWGATVITNLFTAIPIIGPTVAYWLWGGFSIANATLTRFFSLHYVLPFLIAALALIHLVLLHKDGSNNPLGLCSKADKISFYPYFYVKDLLGFLLCLLIYSDYVFLYPNVLGHVDNYIEANPIVTPVHIVPEWYFLPYYAILRSIPNKLLGVVCMVASLVILILLPFFFRRSRFIIRSAMFKPVYAGVFWLFVIDIALLGWLGAHPVEKPFILAGQIGTLYYFLFFGILLPFLVYVEQTVIIRVISRHYSFRHVLHKYK